jgi:hypothetical protein
VGINDNSKKKKNKINSFKQKQKINLNFNNLRLKNNHFFKKFSKTKNKKILIVSKINKKFN